MAKNRITVAGIVGTVAVATLFLSGCAGGGDSTSSSQTKTQACDIMQTPTKSLLSSLSTVGNDVAAAAKAIDSHTTNLNKAAKKITNSDVKPSATAFSSAMTKANADLQKSIADPSNTELTSAFSADETAVTNSIVDLSKVCNFALAG